MPQAFGRVSGTRPPSPVNRLPSPVSRQPSPVSRILHHPLRQLPQCRHLAIGTACLDTRRAEVSFSAFQVFTDTGLCIYHYFIADTEILSHPDLAVEYHVVADYRIAANTDLGSKKTTFPDHYIVADVDVAVQLGTHPDHCIPGNSFVDGA